MELTPWFLQWFSFVLCQWRRLRHLSTSVTQGCLCVYITTATPVTAAKHTHPHFCNCPRSSAVVPERPWPRPPHKSPVEAQQIRVRWIAPPLFVSLPSYYPHISQTNFSQTVQIVAAIKAFLSFPLPFLLWRFWQEARPCWSGRPSVPVPKLTQPIERGNHDLTNKRNRGLQRGGCLGLEEQ